MSWVIFDERGTRVPRCVEMDDYGHLTGVHKFADDREITPTWFAARMATGWRVFQIECAPVVAITDELLQELWCSACPDHKRLPTITAVEMYVRHKS